MTEKLCLVPQEYKSIKVYPANTLTETLNGKPEIEFKHYLDTKDNAKVFYIDGLTNWEEKAKRYIKILFKVDELYKCEVVADDNSNIQVKLALVYTADGEPCTKNKNKLFTNNTLLIHEYIFDVLTPFKTSQME